MKTALVTILLLCMQAPLLAKKHQHGPKNAPVRMQVPFAAGEQLEYQAYYNWGFLWLDAARVLFSVEDSVIDKKEVFIFQSSGRSLDEYDWFFKVRNHYSSTADCESLSPLRFSRNTLEGDYKAEEEYRFDQNVKKVYISSENSDEPFTIDTLNIGSRTFDLLTAIYFARTVDYTQMKPGSKIPIKVISDGEVYDLYFRYNGKEDIEVHGSEERYRCAKYSAMLIAGTVFNAGEDMTVWVTDDQSRIPVQVEAKISVGSVKAVLKNVSGNKYPLTSRIVSK